MKKPWGFFPARQGFLSNLVSLLLGVLVVAMLALMLVPLISIILRS